MFLLRGFEFTHEAVRDWEERFAPLLAEQIRGKRKGKVGRRWYADETYIKVKGKWCYLYRAIDRDGNLVDSMLSATRDMDAAQRFFSQRSVYGELSADTDHYRWSRLVSAGDPGKSWSEGEASVQCVPQPAD
jgi:transposase-like protein